jgi:hypothetical protein
MPQYVRRGLIDLTRGKGVADDAEFGECSLSVKGAFKPPRSMIKPANVAQVDEEEPLYILIEADSARDIMIAENSLRRRAAELAASPRCIAQVPIRRDQL